MTDPKADWFHASTRLDDGRSPLYPSHDLAKLNRWLTIHQDAYVHQEHLKETARYEAAHPLWECTVTYSAHIDEELLARVVKLERDGVPWAQWPPDVGAAKRVLDYEAVRDNGCSLHDPEDFRPLWDRTDIVRVLNATHGAMGACVPSNYRDLLKRYPRASVWIYFTAEQVAGWPAPTGWYTVHSRSGSAHVRIWNLDFTPWKNFSYHGYDHVYLNVYTWDLSIPPSARPPLPRSLYCRRLNREDTGSSWASKAVFYP